MEYPDPEHVDRARRITRGTLAPAEVSRQRVRKLVDHPAPATHTPAPPAEAAVAKRCGWQVETKEAPPEAASRRDSLRQRSFMVEDPAEIVHGNPERLEDHDLHYPAARQSQQRLQNRAGARPRRAAISQGGREVISNRHGLPQASRAYPASGREQCRRVVCLQSIEILCVFFLAR